ncbi:tail completion protein gp17 [Sphingobium sp. TCM1]|uniref:tail completion protein gp17 n=1 Tax=Sphingobium sp. TCM1 TaxID=453246 RepID=UPI0007F4F889|nr:DUF3168 domain-containing protein [Sphingobium sp. TCM1]OAN51848.1 hypothetical protein A7Q26_09145 [Sphingobium sp. TCM1]
MDSAFYSALKSFTGSAKVYPVLAPDDAVAPMVVYQRTSTQRDLTIDGLSGLVSASYRIDIYATSLKAAQSLSDTVVIGLSQHKEAPINYITIDNEFDGSDLSGDPKLFRMIVEVTAHFNL